MPIEFLSGFLIRLSGFSFSHLEAFRFAETLAALEARGRARAALGEAGRRVVEVLDALSYDDHPAFADRAVYVRLRRRIRRVYSFAAECTGDIPAEAIAECARALPELAAPLEALSEASRALAASQRALEEVYAAELEKKRERLRELLRAGERLREAVFLESPNAYEGIASLITHAGPRNARAKGRERTAMMYLQRFCAKNDTNSMCGPLGIGFIEEGQGPVRLALERELAARKTYFSFWAADRLHEVLLASTGAQATFLRRNPASRLDEEKSEIEWCRMSHDATTMFSRTYARAAATPELSWIFRFFDRPRLASEAIEAFGRENEVEDEEAAALIDQLAEAGLLLGHPSIPVGVFDPLAVVRSSLDAAAPERKLGTEAIAPFEKLTSAFATAPLEARMKIAGELEAEFERVTGEASRRGEGKHYSDRGLLHEDCYASLSAELKTGAIAPLGDAIEAIVRAVSIPLELRRENVRAWFRAKFGEGARRPLLEVHLAFDRDTPYTIEADSAAAVELRRRQDAVRSALREAMASAKDGEARMTVAELRRLVAGAPFGERPGYASADVMIARGTEGVRWVLGEMHGFFMVPTFWCDVMPENERERLLREQRGVLAALAGGVQTAEPLFLHTQATDRRFPVAESDLMIIGHSDRARAHALGDLELELRGDRFAFSRAGREVIPISPYSAYPFLTYTTPIAPFIDEFADRFPPTSIFPDEFAQNDAPRLLLGDVVLRRRLWVRTAGELAAALEGEGDLAVFAAAGLMRERVGCDRTVFASIPGEPKPVFVDFDSPFLVEAFAHLIRRADPASRVKLSEMLPGPRDLFLLGPDGPRTFELRMGVYRRESVERG